MTAGGHHPHQVVRLKLPIGSPLGASDENRAEEMNRKVDLLDQVPQEKKIFLDEVVDALCLIPGMVAVVLGGSYARGTYHPHSDLDVGLYYSETNPFSVAEIRRVAADFSAGQIPVVTDFYEWGPWVNGGAWIQTRVGKLDFLYRNLDQVQRVIQEARKGISRHDYDQQPTYGFRSVVYLAETHICVPLYDPSAVIAQIKRDVAVYPQALKQNIIADSLWNSEFTLLFARNFASAGDVYNTAGCVTRIANYLIQALFALNETYFINDKGAMEAIERLPTHPPNFSAGINRILARPGETVEELSESVRVLESIWQEVIKLAGSAYKSRYEIS